MDDSLKKWLPWIAGAAVLLIIVAIFGLTRAGGDDVAAPTTTAEATTTIPASTTSLATTTVPVSTTSLATTTVPPTTVPPTTVPPTTEPPTTEPPTTEPPTTEPPTTEPPPTIPDLPPEELILEADGVGALETFVSFGADDEGAIAAVTLSLGPNTRDTGWIPSFSEYGTCPGNQVRGVEWGSFVMLFTDGETDFDPAGTEHFFSYYYTEPAQPDFATPEMIEIGSTVADLIAAYDGPDFDIGPSEFDPDAAFWVSGFADDQTGLWGYATGEGDTDTVISINGGIGCGE